MENKRIKLHMAEHDGTNGICIYCKSCGAEFEETCQGNYPPLEYEDEKYSRRCQNCINRYGK